MTIEHYIHVHVIILTQQSQSKKLTVSPLHRDSINQKNGFLIIIRDKYLEVL